MGNACDKIEDGIWLGDRGVYDKECPEYTRFQTIITAMTEEEVKKYNIQKYAGNRNWLHIDVDDDSVNITQHFQHVIDHVEAARKRGDCVLIHCMGGVSRSPTLMAAYLMWKHQWSAQTSLDYIYTRRTVIRPNDEFVKQLHAYESKMIPDEHTHVQENIETN